MDLFQFFFPTTLLVGHVSPQAFGQLEKSGSRSPVFHANYNGCEQPTSGFILIDRYFAEHLK